MSAPRLQQSQKQVQSLILSPQLRHSLKILQAPALELRNTIKEEMETNPTLEEISIEGDSFEEAFEGPREANTDLASDRADFTKELEFLAKLDQDSREYFGENSEHNVYTSEDADRRKHFFDSLVAETSLHEHIMNQVHMSDVSEDVIEAMPYVLGSLDESGFLNSSLSDIAIQGKLSLESVQKAVELLKSLDPAGIGCENLQTSLLFQIELQGLDDSLAHKIVKNHYELLLRRRIPEIARHTSTSKEQVEDAINFIGKLNPTPARKFADDPNRDVVPDVKVEKDGDGWAVILNNDYIPKLRISSIYKELLAKEDTPSKDRTYIKDKINASKFLINAIGQRQQTIERITRVLLDLQSGFFKKGVPGLVPLTMSQVAEIIGVHETTVSRAIANKYIDTQWGTFDFKFFFTSGYTDSSGQAIANTSIKKIIAEIISSEDSHRPLSDQKIVEIMKERDIQIARRTVAKYREEMGIPATNLRRTYK